jgi:hypothetical protein
MPRAADVLLRRDGSVILARSNVTSVSHPIEAAGAYDSRRVETGASGFSATRSTCGKRLQVPSDEAKRRASDSSSVSSNRPMPAATASRTNATFSGGFVSRLVPSPIRASGSPPV